MVEVLQEKGVGLTPEQVKCLQVVAELRLPGSGEVVARGQPMGSLMSFPLLCLINKTVVDLALVDMASTGKITWKEFRAHRCLINGDDLLYRELNNSSDRILSGILGHGSRCGLIVNEEKTMVSPDWAEVNSTAFFQGRREKKTNVSVVEWSSQVTDPVGFLVDSVRRPSTFRRLLSNWARPIRNALKKVQGPIPPQFLRELWRFKGPLTWLPSPPPKTPNPFPIAPLPEGYGLTRGEEVRCISERVVRLKLSGYIPPKPGRCSTDSGEEQSMQSALRKEKPCVEDSILKVLADAWEKKVKEKLWLEDDVTPALTTWAWDERPRIQVLLDGLSAFNKGKLLACAMPDAGLSCPGDGEPSRVEGVLDYIGLE